jgi:hypothetical protein
MFRPLELVRSDDGLLALAHRLRAAGVPQHERKPTLGHELRTGKGFLEVEHTLSECGIYVEGAPSLARSGRLSFLAGSIRLSVTGQN